MPKLKRLTLIFVMLLVVLTVMMLIGIWSLQHTAAIQSLAGYCNQYFVGLMVCRLLLMSGLLFFWPSLVNTLGKCWHWSTETIAHLSGKRLWIIGCLLSVELLNMLTKINW